MSVLFIYYGQHVSFLTAPKCIFQLWVEYFKTKDSVSAVIPASNYKDIVSMAEKYPTVSIFIRFRAVHY